MGGLWVWWPHWVTQGLWVGWERRVGGPGLQGDVVGWVICCRPGALTGRSEGSESSMGGLWVWWPHWVTQGLWFGRERRVRGPGLQGDVVGWVICCRPGALTGRLWVGRPALLALGIDEAAGHSKGRRMEDRRINSGHFRWVLNQSANWMRSFSMPGQPWSLPGSRMSLKVAPDSRAFFSKISA
jgi:hypothetical protein